MTKNERLQHHLKTIRMLLGKTTEEFGNAIGVTKQTVSNYEKNEVKISSMAYIAVRTMIDVLTAQIPDKDLRAFIVWYISMYVDGESTEDIELVNALATAMYELGFVEPIREWVKKQVPDLEKYYDTEVKLPWLKSNV